MCFLVLKPGFLELVTSCGPNEVAQDSCDPQCEMTCRSPKLSKNCKDYCSTKPGVGRSERSGKCRCQDGFVRNNGTTCVLLENCDGPII
ncbi:hypothetical protein B9Z55_020076 [Caenorhabditis nigoni]|nr:hypothetical protein B9Z55_020076 [Caenorhabditis nigoni]